MLGTCSNISLYIYVARFYPFFHQWTFRLLLFPSTAVNKGVHVFSWIIILSEYMPRSGLLDHMVALFLVFFKEPPYCSPWWLHQFTFPSTMWGLPFFPLLSPICIQWNIACVRAHSLSQVWFCNPMDCNPLGASVYGTLQARILEWVTISSPYSWPRDCTRISSTGKQILYRWATREAPEWNITQA